MRVMEARKSCLSFAVKQPIDVLMVANLLLKADSWMNSAEAVGCFCRKDRAAAPLALVFGPRVCLFITCSLSTKKPRGNYTFIGLYCARIDLS